jgi:5-methyltetrahydrofolate--homocysteine methyltransferase
MQVDLNTFLTMPGVADGGWSTQLQMRGMPTTAPAEVANITHAELVLDLTRAYVSAGAGLITTNTFAANELNFTRQQIDHEVVEVNRRGAQLTREGLGGRPGLVAGSIGPSGKMLAVREITEEQLTTLFRAQAEGLAAGGADVIVLETFSELKEILVALRTVKETTGLPVIASMSFDSGPQRTRTMMGAQAGDCAATLEEAGADAIGCNCGAGINHILPVVVALRAATRRPLWVKPNAGMPELENGRPVWRQAPEEFGAFVPQLLEAGANIIGGCCGSGPEHIRKVAAVVAHRTKHAAGARV